MSAPSLDSALLPWWHFGFWGTWGIRWQAWLDAIRDLPSTLPSERGAPVITPHLEALRAAARHDFHLERKKADRDIDSLHRREVDLGHERDALQRRIGEMTFFIAQFDASVAANYEMRRAGEKGTDITVIRRRRRREADKERNEIRAAVQKVNAELTRVEAELAGVPDRIAAREEQFLSSCGAIDEHVGALMSVYWRTLVRHHSRRATLSKLWNPTPTPLKAWLVQFGVSR